MGYRSAGVDSRAKDSGIDLWNDADRTIEQVIAFVSDLQVARAAYEAAVKAKPGKRITLRQRARVLERNFPRHECF